MMESSGDAIPGTLQPFQDSWHLQVLVAYDNTVRQTRARQAACRYRRTRYPATRPQHGLGIRHRFFLPLSRIPRYVMPIFGWHLPTFRVRCVSGKWEFIGSFPLPLFSHAACEAALHAALH